ncbi:hypothetical protein B4135_0533 [Caldibacillus debilis]|uniref:Uncharacterized protein n=1 Tax=Caldibacillus debilis TaxID=301148 RepID=A0A150M9M1_9BACI|nr:hypothetical protein B4135_0533 [Caldibacillus debilis]
MKRNDISSGAKGAKRGKAIGRPPTMKRRDLRFIYQFKRPI